MSTDAAPRAPHAKPPVTESADWPRRLRPWLEDVADSLEVQVEDPGAEVDRLHVMTGTVAEGVQRSMAPISTYLVGLAVGRGASLEEACRMVEDLSRG